MNIFRNTNIKTAKEHVDSKRNNEIFNDLKNNPGKNKLTCIKNDKISRYNNHSSLIKLTKGYYNYYQNGKCVSRNEDFVTNYEAEKFSKKCKDKYIDNTNLNYNYVSQTVDANDNTEINGLLYTEKNTTTFVDNNQKFTDKTQYKEVKCFDLHSKKIKDM